MNVLTIVFSVIFAHNCNSLIREETDLKPLSNYETVDNENFENWEGEPDDANVVVFDKVSESTLEEICKNSKNYVYLKQEDVIIDCKNFKNDEPEKTERIFKRSAVGDEVEGSGDSENSENVTTEKNKVSEETVTPEKNENTTLPPEEKKDEEAEKPLSENSNNTTTPPEKEKNEEVKEEENTTPLPETTEVPEKPEIVTPEEPSEQVPSEITTTEKPKEQPERQENSDKWSPKKDAEIIKGKTLIGGNKMEQATDQQSDESEKVGESSKTAHKAGSKDTTILIGLFVAVIVVGGLAYGYNVIKKRKQRSADLERVERGPSIKTSLNNLTKPDEPENKPLIGEKKEVEMVDMKKENSTPEKAPSDNELL